MQTKQRQVKVVKGRLKAVDNTVFFALSLPALILVILFSYLPMYGIVLAFKKYQARLGIMGSPWVGFENFEFLFKSEDLPRILFNTVFLNAFHIFACLVASVSFAMLMYEVRKAWQVKTFQTMAILPHFMSWVVCSFMVYSVLEHNHGLANQTLAMIGLDGVEWYTKPGYWPVILCIVAIWHGTGLSSIYYYASLIGMDKEIIEAAEIDGASKLQRIRYISIPHLIPIISIRTIMSIGHIFRSDFGLFYNVPRNLGILYPTTDVIDTYVYRALMENRNYGMSSAASFFQSVVCLIILLTVNAIVKRKNPENSLF